MTKNLHFFKRLNGYQEPNTLLVIRNYPKCPDLRHDVQIRRWVQEPPNPLNRPSN